jgi:hypothetical protein
MQPSIAQERYSTVAEFELRVNDRSYSVVEVAPGFITLEKAVEIPPCEADLYIRVEGEEMHRRIRLPQGASAKSDHVVIER